ncbi:MAG: hypothetical protein EXS52_02165 [Candidatus Staskawiczbacteria bacterium]|nr:hypothetical protein [Candidatus Staskawiczbacteria bacterium]
MRKARFSGNHLFVPRGSVDYMEVRITADGCSLTTPHLDRIQFAEMSGDGMRVVSYDIGGNVRICDLRLSNPDKVIWRGGEFPRQIVTGIGINNAVTLFALAAGPQIDVYSIKRPDQWKLSWARIVTDRAITAIEFDADSNIVCQHEGQTKKVTLGL